MGIIRAALAVALLGAGTTGAEIIRLATPVGIEDPSAGYVTREWRWTDGGVTTVFTAFGPPEQVEAFDPHGSPLKCPDCLLASSTRIGPMEAAGAAGTTR